MPDPVNLLGPPEFWKRFSGRFFGRFRGIVKENRDPRKLGRVRVICRPVYGESLSPWCLPDFPLGGSVEGGMVFVPGLESIVWIQFEEGRKDFPVYTGGFYQEVGVGRPDDGSPIENNARWQNNQNPLPSHAQGIPDGSDFDGGIKGTEGVPRSNFGSVYPHNRVIRTPSGHMIELDDTPTRERVQIHHRSGAHIEILPDGTINIISDGNLRTRSKAETNRVEGDQRQTIRGSAFMDIQGDFVVNVGGAYRITQGASGTTTKPAEDAVISGDLCQKIKGSLKQTVLNSVSIQSGGDMAIGAMGNLNIQSGGFGSIVFSNSQNLPLPTAPLAESLRIQGMNGKVILAGTDATGLASQLGLEIQPQGSPSQGITPILPDIGPHVFIGNLAVPRPFTAAPLTFEPVPLGLQLVTYLNQLHNFLTGWMADYIAHTHPMFSPAVTAPAFAAQFPAQLAALTAQYLTPTSAELQAALVSDLVFTSKA